MITRYLISVRNIPWTVSHFELEKYFSAFGSIKNAKVIFNKNGLSTGYGFVEFYDAEAMNEVFRKRHVLEQETLFIAVGTKYLKEEGFVGFLDSYVQESTEETEKDENEESKKDETVMHTKLHKAANVFVRKMWDSSQPSVLKDLLNNSQK